MGCEKRPGSGERLVKGVGTVQIRSVLVLLKFCIATTTENGGLSYTSHFESTHS